jgi:methyl-accepting chemotaxis protein
MNLVPPADAPPASSSLNVSAAATRTEARDLPLIGKRRSLIINPGFQVQAMLLPTLISVATVTGLVISLFLVMQSADAELPAEYGMLKGLWDAAEARWLVSSICGALVFAALMITIGLVETHRAAGAVFKMQRHIHRVAAGDLDARVYLRKGDHFQDVAEDFNRMVDALKDDVRHDLEQIHRALDVLGQVRPAGRDEASLRLAAAWDTLVALQHRKERTTR